MSYHNLFRQVSSSAYERGTESTSRSGCPADMFMLSPNAFTILFRVNDMLKVKKMFQSDL